MVMRTTDRNLPQPLGCVTRHPSEAPALHVFVQGLRIPDRPRWDRALTRASPRERRGQTQSAYLRSVGGKADVRCRHHARRQCANSGHLAARQVAAETINVVTRSAEALRQDGTINPRLGWLRGRAPRDGAVSYVGGKFGRSARAFSRPIAPSSAADKPSSFMRRAVSFSGTNGLSLPNKI
jgi:hypothetical protein